MSEGLIFAKFNNGIEKQHHNPFNTKAFNFLYVDRVEDNAFHYMTYMATPWHKTPTLGGHDIENFGRLFIVQH